ncbi:MAG: M23 family metallopeptidase, partial [Phascolarctobacterium sp.]|nr:M23 family metallopeptidase [Phascolarctobacterium sp.]
HDYGYKTAYAHMSELYVSHGDYVTKGEVIGAIGSTGNSTGPHLHYEVLLWGQETNPRDLM